MNMLKPVGFAVLGAAVAAAAFGNVPPPPQPPPKVGPPAAVVWEYRVLNNNNENEFNRLGAEGWELANSFYSPSTGGPVHAFKRRR